MTAEPATAEPASVPGLTLETLRFLLGLVNNLTLNVGADDFDEAVVTVTMARRELAEAIAETEKTAP